LTVDDELKFQIVSPVKYRDSISYFILEVKMILQTIWFFLWGLLWAVFFMTDGFDFGVGTLYPFIGKNDEDKRT